MDYHPIQGGVEMLPGASCYRNWKKLSRLAWRGAWHTHMLAGFTFTSELPFASFSERVLVQNVSHKNDLIFMRRNVQVTYISYQ